MYLGPEESLEPGSATFYLDLPVAVGDLEVELTSESVIGPGALATVILEMGPAPSELVEVNRFTTGNVVDIDTQERLSRVMRGARRIYVRYTVENAPSGDSYSYGCALRTRAIPKWADSGELLWHPALTIRVREEQGP